MLRCRFILMRLQLRQGKMMQAPSLTPILWFTWGKIQTFIYFDTALGNNNENDVSPWRILLFADVLYFTVCVRLSHMFANYLYAQSRRRFLTDLRQNAVIWLAGTQFLLSQRLYRVSLIWTLRSSAEKYLLSLI
jgi:hypothetical protein